MVRVLAVEDSLKDDLENALNKSSCSILIGSIFEDKRYVVAIFQVPLTGDLERDFEASVQQLQYALPGGCYLIGLISNEKVISLLNIIRKGNQKLQKLIAVDEQLFEPSVLCRSGNKFDGKVLIDGQLKPLSTKYQSFFSSWNEVSSYINIDQTLVLPKFENVKQWKMSFRTEICSIIKNLSTCKIHFKGNTCKGNKSYFEDPGKAKNAIGKVLHPKLILPLTKNKDAYKTSVSMLVGSLYTHIFIPPKMTTEHTREIMLEDIARSLYCRAESYCEFAEQEIETRCENSIEDSSIRLPYRVTFPIGLVELSVYLLQDEKISQAEQVASELFDLQPNNIRAHEECKELVSTDRDISDDEKDTQLKNIVMATLGGVVALLVSFVFVSNTFSLS